MERSTNDTRMFVAGTCCSSAATSHGGALHPGIFAQSSGLVSTGWRAWTWCPKWAARDATWAARNGWMAMRAGPENVFSVAANEKPEQALLGPPPPARTGGHFLTNHGHVQKRHAHAYSLTNHQAGHGCVEQTSALCEAG
jgi:hypothetical protein